MSFVRPEVAQNLYRWREALVGAVIAVLGFWAAMEGFGFLAIVGAVLMVAGIGLSLAGWQRARFRQGSGGPGVVSVTEGQITYFGPFTGGAMAIDSIYEVILNPHPRSGAVWELRSPTAEDLRIPTNAEGADSLFDVFGALPGLSTEAMLAELQNLGPTPKVIWTRRLLH